MPGLPAGALPATPRLRVAAAGLSGLGRWRPFVIAAALAGLASLAFLWVTATQVGGQAVTTPIDDIGEAVASALAAVSCGVAAWRSAGRVRVAWALFAASAATWTAGESGSDHESPPLAGTLAAAAGDLQPRARRERAGGQTSHQARACGIKGRTGPGHLSESVC